MVVGLEKKVYSPRSNALKEIDDAVQDVNDNYNTCDSFDGDDTSIYQRGISGGGFSDYESGIIPFNDLDNALSQDFSYLEKSVMPQGEDGYDTNSVSVDDIGESDLSPQELGEVAEKVITESMLKLGDRVNPEVYESFSRRVNLMPDGAVWLEFYRSTSKFPGSNINITLHNNLN